MIKYHRGAHSRTKRNSKVFGWSWGPIVICMGIALLGGHIYQSAWANENTALSGKGDPGTISEDEVAKKIVDLKQRIEIASAAENENTAKQMGVTLADLVERTAKLQSIQSVYERVLTALKKKTAQKQSEVLLREQFRTAKQVGIAQQPPYNLSFYDAILDEWKTADQQLESISRALHVSRRVQEDANSRLEITEKTWRSLKDELTSASKTESRQTLEWNFNKAQLEKELAEALIIFEKINYDNLSQDLRIAELKSQHAAEKLKWVRSNLHFDEADLQKHLKALKASKKGLEERIQDLVSGRNEAEEAWLTAQQRFKATMQEKQDPVTEAVLKEREAWFKTFQAVLEQTEDALGLLGHQEHLWQLRYSLVDGRMQDEEAIKQREEINSHTKNIKRALNIEQSYQTNLQSQIAVLEKKLSDEDIDKSARASHQNLLKAMQKLAERRSEYISILLATEQMDQRVLDEIDLMLGTAPVEQRLMRIKRHFEKIWGFEVWVIDDHSVTVRKLFVALVFLIVGILLAKYFLRAISARLLSLTQLKETTALAIQKTLTYFAYLLVLLFALRVVNIPLTAFAFLGGAIAIGVGFGAQNLINNFISGFIMMAERPINIGDLIEIEGMLGKVEEIGARRTRIRTGENIDILVPNSSFLEKNITNWTLSDRKIRARVSVGVVYGSPVKEVEKLLLKAVTENEKVLQEPEPFVIFGDFGDNALIFEVDFWIYVRQIIERRLIESSIRYGIDELFREVSIVIAFPQRDVHLDTHKLE